MPRLWEEGAAPPNRALHPGPALHPKVQCFVIALCGLQFSIHSVTIDADQELTACQVLGHKGKGDGLAPLRGREAATGEDS